MRSVSIPAGRRLDAFVAWFECDFPGDLTLSTAPTKPATHWKQTAFYLREPLEGWRKMMKHEYFLLFFLLILLGESSLLSG
jgi:hypothetical protein